MGRDNRGVEGGTLSRRVEIGVGAIHENVEQNLITITEDRLRLRLMEHASALERKRAWVAPLGISIAIGLALLTSEFKNFGLPSSAWQAMFWMIEVAATVWLCVEVVRAIRAPKIDDLIERIKRG